MKLHPIRKMQQQQLKLWGNTRKYPTYDAVEAADRKLLARHVKPLLDALWDDHTICRDMETDKECRICRLLAEWRGPIK